MASIRCWNEGAPPRLLLITDRQALPDLDGGVRHLLLREKGGEGRRLWERAQEMARLCRSCGAALLVHGWVEVTLEGAGAHPLWINLVLRVRAAGIRPRRHAGKAQYAHQPQTAPTIAFGADSNYFA